MKLKIDMIIIVVEFLYDIFQNFHVFYVIFGIIQYFGNYSINLPTMI